MLPSAKAEESDFPWVFTGAKQLSTLSRFQQSRDRGGAWLLARQADDGAFPASAPDIASYYQVPVAFQACGRSDAALRLCDWIRRHGLTPDGDFGPRSDAAMGHSYAYLNGWVICGAHRLGQFDLSQRGMTFVLGFRDTESGGFYSSATERGADTKQDLINTTMGGLAALYTGRADVARGAGEWLRNLLEAQPDFPAKFYTVYSREVGLHTSPPAGELDRHVVHSDAERDQHFFNIGIAAAFLCRLSQATGESQWLALAREVMRFAEVASDCLFRNVRAGKVGWAATLLALLTGESKYREMAIRIGENLLALQAEEGYWSAPGQSGPNDDSTAERVVWINTICQVADGQ